MTDAVIITLNSKEIQIQVQFKIILLVENPKIRSPCPYMCALGYELLEDKIRWWPPQKIPAMISIDIICYKPENQHSRFSILCKISRCKQFK